MEERWIPRLEHQLPVLHTSTSNVEPLTPAPPLGLPRRSITRPSEVLTSSLVHTLVHPILLVLMMPEAYVVARDLLCLSILASPLLQNGHALSVVAVPQFSVPTVARITVWWDRQMVQSGRLPVLPLVLSTYSPSTFWSLVTPSGTALPWSWDYAYFSF